MWLAIVPTLLLVGGWLALLARSLSRERLRSSPERLLVGLLPLAGIVGMLYFTVSYPTPDGDVVKATYMLTTVPAWALCFGYGARLGARAPAPAPACLSASCSGSPRCRGSASRSTARLSASSEARRRYPLPP